MKHYPAPNFLLETATAEKLYFDYAEQKPIYDYHCHLPVKDIAENRRFQNLTQLWLDGDHYKWRAMRSMGIDEYYITGPASPEEKFRAWAGVVPYTIRNPLYHWTHLELKRPFGISDRLLSEATSEEIYGHCNELLQTEAFTARGIIEQMSVKVICTTDDPLHDLACHQQIQSDPGFKTTVLPCFRPDNAFNVDDPPLFNRWLDRLQILMDRSITGVESLLSALFERMDFFHERGCRLSDHGVAVFRYHETTTAEADAVFRQARRGERPEREGCRRFLSFMLKALAERYAELNWSQQFHIGPLRNTNTRMYRNLGPDSGFDSIGDRNFAEPLYRFLDALDVKDRLARTILYNINPRDNEMIATMIGNFQDGATPGKMQFGAGWWFNDHKLGMERQLNALSSMGLLSRFVGMLTDSRSFLSFPRHEYFRRILCNLLGNEIENGELPNDLPFIGSIVEDICCYNAENYFQMT